MKSKEPYKRNISIIRVEQRLTVFLLKNPPDMLYALFMFSIRLNVVDLHEVE